MSRDRVIAWAAQHFDRGQFFEDLARRVAIPTESQNPARGAELAAYLDDEIAPALTALGYACRRLENPKAPRMPFLFAERREGADRPTVLTYGHGDVVRGMEEDWRDGLDPWRLTREGERWYGRGTADNKGQHSINLAGLAAVLAVKGSLGFTSKILIETGEEMGSPGLHDVARRHADSLGADVLIGSDGPRLLTERATLFTGSRGSFNFDMSVELRRGGHHSGNWGGLLANPGVILAHAIASIVSKTGQVLVPGILPRDIPASIRRELADCPVERLEGPAIDPTWGEPGLTLAEKVFAWNTFEVLAFSTGNPQHPANAIPPQARATCQIRYVAGTDPRQLLPTLRRHLDAHGFSPVTLSPRREEYFSATRLDPENPWVRWAAGSIEETTGERPTILPNIGGTLPNEVFAEILGMPTLWVPHSYTACSQHAPDEHLLAPIAREGLRVMAGLFWDLGEQGAPA
jgi:acetylornithine deacetylase/succinyl-diaminopimelate desuccinylase-like protein